MRTERENLTNHRVFSVTANVEFLSSLSLWAAKEHVHLGQSFRRTRLDALNLPCKLRIVAEGSVHECIYGIFGWQINV